MNSSISIILVETENPDNIGAAARAMKNMGLGDLRLVRPPAFWKRKGRKLAMAARNVLEKASVFRTLEAAVHDAGLVIGTTRREGRRRGRFLSFSEALERVRRTVSAGKKAAIVFGKESKGLSNKHLVCCDWMTRIPSHPDYPSINLAQAVMIIAFSLYGSSESPQIKSEIFLIDKKEVGITLKHFSRAVHALGYKPAVEKRVLATFRALLKRSGLLASESQMIKGLSRRIAERSAKCAGDLVANQ